MTSTSTLPSIASLAPALALIVTAAACGGAAVTAAPPPTAAGAGATPPPLGQMAVGASAAAGNDMLWNSDFAEGTMQPWTTSISAPAAGEVRVVGEEACLRIDAGGANSYDLVLRQRPVPLAPGHSYQIRFKAHATAPTRIRPRLVQISAPHTEYWSAVVDVGAAAQTFTGTFAASQADDGADFAIHFGGDLAGKAPLTVCLDDVEINDPKFEIPAARAHGPLPRIRVNQVGYLPDQVKSAIVKSTSQEPLDWLLIDGSNNIVATGKTRPYGEDKAAGELDQLIDFSPFKAPGKGYRIKIGAEESPPFEIGRDLYKRLKYDALAFFYQQRSGVEIAMPYAGGAQWVRPGWPPRRQERAVRPGGQVQLLARRVGRLVRRRRPRQVRGQRRHLRVDPAERVRARQLPREERGRARRRQAQRPRGQERRARHPRRSPLRGRVDDPHAGARGAAARRAWPTTRSTTRAGRRSRPGPIRIRSSATCAPSAPRRRSTSPPAPRRRRACGRPSIRPSPSAPSTPPSSPGPPRRRTLPSSPRAR